GRPAAVLALAPFEEGVALVEHGLHVLGVGADGGGRRRQGGDGEDGGDGGPGGEFSGSCHDGVSLCPRSNRNGRYHERRPMAKGAPWRGRVRLSYKTYRSYRSYRSYGTIGDPAL